MDISFIGGGNMASAIIGGLLKTGYSAASIGVVEIAPEAREGLAQRYGVSTFDAVSSEAVAAECVVLAVKPQQMREVATALRPLLGPQLVLSIAAGIRAADLARWLGGHAKIARAMPNTPALVGAGLAGLYAMPGVGPADRKRAAGILDAVGTSLWVESEDQLDAITAISGSGPAYVFYFIEALQLAAVEAGFAPDVARRLALETFGGAIKLAQLSPEDAATLRARVTSKGGTTERAIQSLETSQVRSHITKAVRAAGERSRELGIDLGSN